MKRTLLLSLLLVGCAKKGDEAGRQRLDTEKDTGRGGPIVGGAGSGSSEITKGGPGGVQLLLDGDLEISAGSIDKDIVRKVVKDNTTKLQYCYEKTLLASPGIEGKVLATFTIATDGSVEGVKAAGVHPDVEACVADAVKAFKFPPSAAKVEVSYPFTFKPA